jgi:ABC-type multidrug transport system fused ATPase/permease subunit
MTGLIQRWREVRGAFAHTPQAVRLVWQTSPWATVGLGLLTLGGALLPAAQAWVGKLIVDGVVAATKTGADPEQSRTVFIYLIVELILFLLSAALNQARRLIQQLIQLRLANRIRADIIRKALSLDLAHFEHPEFYDRLQNARREGGYKPTELINDTFQIVQAGKQDVGISNSSGISTYDVAFSNGQTILTAIHTYSRDFGLFRPPADPILLTITVVNPSHIRFDPLNLPIATVNNVDFNTANQTAISFGILGNTLGLPPIDQSLFGPRAISVSFWNSIFRA